MKAKVTFTEPEIKQAITEYITKRADTNVKSISSVKLDIKPGYQSSDQRDNTSPSVTAEVEIDLAPARDR